jgi:predicted Rdx family selenoprotein
MQFAQELLSTFSTALGEVALVPVSGGVFVVTVSRSAAETAGQVEEDVIWDRKRDGGFPGLFPPSLSID